MHRFYCTECKQVKRVRRLPTSVESTFYIDTAPQDRIGQCDYHTMGRVRPVRTRPVYTKSKPVVTNTPKKTKRGNR